MVIFNHIKHLYNQIINTLLTQRSEEGVEYVWKRRRPDTLLIVFSGMGDYRYNYMRSLQQCNFSQLFIRDCWAGNASYYWYEHQSNHPELFTQHLIDKIIKAGHYSRVITIGSSKGGTAAIYYGLKMNASDIYAGACQYYVGDYLGIHQIKERPEQWRDVVGEEHSQEWIDILNHKLPDMIKARKGCDTIIHLLYSTEEHTYTEHVAPMLTQLDECGIRHEDQIESFTSHSKVGDYFKTVLMKVFHE